MYISQLLIGSVATFYVVIVYQVILLFGEHSKPTEGFEHVGL